MQRSSITVPFVAAIVAALVLDSWMPVATVANVAQAQELAPPSPPSERVTLEQALERVDARSTNVRLAGIARARAEVAEREALASVLPTLEGAFTYTRYDQEVKNGDFVIREVDALQSDLTLRVAVSAQAIHATTLAERSRRVSEQTEADARRLARGAAARVFFAVLSAKNTALLARSQRDKAQEQLDAVRQRLEAGVATGLDVMRAELAVLELERRVVETDGALVRTWELLGEALGEDHPVDVEESSLPLPGESTSHLEALAVRERPDIAATRTNHQLAEETLTNAWLRFVPTLAASWNGRWSGSTTTFSPDSLSWYAVLSLELPLYDGGARYAAQRDAQLVIAQAQEQEAALLRSIRIEVRDAHRRLQTASQARILAQRALETATRAMEAAELAYRSGAATGIELTEARRDREAAELAVSARTLEVQLALVDLLSATDRL